MALTYEPIATTTLTSASSLITFSSIPSTYTDLRVVIYYSTASGSTAALRLNNDTGGNYGYKGLIGSSSSPIAFNTSGANNIRIPYNTQTNGMAFATFDILGYTRARVKMVLYTVNQVFSSTGETASGVGTWVDNTVVNRVDLFGNTVVNFNIGTQATIYGIKAA